MQVTTSQMLKLIPFCAVGLAVPVVLGTSLGPDEFDRIVTLIGSLLLIPVAWAGLALLIVAPGPARDCLVWRLLLAPLSLLMLALIGGLGIGVLQLLTEPDGAAFQVWGAVVGVGMLAGPWLYAFGRARSPEPPWPTRVQTELAHRLRSIPWE